MEVNPKEFRREVIEVVRAIPKGRVLTYGDVAWLVGWPNHSRFVGHALRGLSETDGVPCHRVVSTSGRTAPCWPQQRALLEAEGVVFTRAGYVDMLLCHWAVQEHDTF